MVSTWRRIRGAVFVSTLAISSVELAQPCCVGAVGCFIAPDVHKCSHDGASDSARTITCA